MIEKAYAKINLSLDVLRKREDGYHDVNMIMQSVELYDTVRIELTDNGIEVCCDNGSVPGGEENIAYRAAKLMLKETGRNCGACIYIEKNIPVCAGMAGGSADGAAVIRAMNVLLGAGYNNERLLSIGSKIGSDVPFCINGGTALAYGTGTQIRQLPSFGKHNVLLVKPSIDVPTPWVYNNLDLSEVAHPDICGFEQALTNGTPLEALALSANVLESVTVKKYSVIEKIKQSMMMHGARLAMMSGSGPTVFGIFDELCDLQKAEKFFKKSFDEVIVTKTV